MCPACPLPSCPQIQPINSTPSWLLAMVGVFCCIGPLTLAGFFTWEKVIKKD